MHNGMAVQNLQLYRKYKKAPALNKRYVLWGKTQRFRTYVSQHFWVFLSTENSALFTTVVTL